MARSPGFSVAAVLTLSLGIGAATAAFNLVSGILIRPLPCRAPARLVTLWERRTSGEELTVSFPNFEDWRSQSRSFEGVTAMRFPSEATVLGGVEPARGTILPVFREFFDVIGVQPFLGRCIRHDENREGGEHVAVLGHGFWQQNFGASRDLGSIRLSISGVVHTVVGGMPPGFKVLQGGDLYLPLEQSPFRKRDSRNYRVIARLNPDVSPKQAENYSSAMGIPLLRGRTFDSADRPENQQVIIVNGALASMVFPAQDPIGELVQFIPFWTGVDLTVVGVVGEARDWRKARGSQPEGFVYWRQQTVTLNISQR